MTARPQFDDRDPQPPREWQPASSEWQREEAKRLTAEAVRKAKEGRMKLPKRDARTPAEIRNATEETAP